MSTAEKVNILVVDDLPEKLLALETVLEELGQNVVTARSGEEALRRVLEQDFAVILLDVNMPPGISGLETAALIRTRRKSAHTPVIFITAFADEMNTAQGYSLGAVDYILSPVVPEILRSKVRVFVELYRMNQQVKRQADERVALAREQAARAAAEEAARRSDFLAGASTALTSSLDYEATLRGLARVAVPFLGDAAAAVAVDDQGRPGPHDLAGPLADAVARALASGETQPLDDPPPGADFRSALVLPLRARRKTLGVLALTRGATGRPYGPADRALAEDLAGRAAIALDNARLHGALREADRRKNEFLSMLAHELRNPLAPIRNALHVLHLSGLDRPELHWAREVIDRQVQHLIRLVDDLLDVSRITRGKIRLQTEPVDVAVVVARAVETSRPLIDARRHELAVNLPGEPVCVQADAIRLSQVLSNLLNNAAKFTDEGGRIGLAVAREGGEVVLRVTDSGAGIPAEMLPCVFDLFMQADRTLDRSQGGLGIGLTLVRHLVEMHGGRVEALSPGVNQGSEFVVRLPLLSGASPAASANGCGTAPAAAPRRVLLVDDNVDAADSLALLLSLGGHEVRAVHDGPSALRAAAEFRPEVVLLDIGLPGMDGYEVARRLRQCAEVAGTLLVAVTGYGREEDRRRSREAGFDFHLVKPADPQQLAELFAARPPVTSSSPPPAASGS
jgi:signal transduction histidine kinase